MDANRSATRDAYRPLRAGLFIYECFRIFILVLFLLLASVETSIDGNYSGTYSVYMSSNALFPLMALFLWLKPEEYINYSLLYTAGKIIALISFYVWEIFSFREFAINGDLTKSLVLLGGGALLSLADMLSVWGAWVINKKYRREMSPFESGGV